MNHRLNRPWCGSVLEFHRPVETRWIFRRRLLERAATRLQIWARAASQALRAWAGETWGDPS